MKVEKYMKRKTLVVLAGALIATSAAQVFSANDEQELIFSGPVDSIDANSGAMSVLNHQVFTRGQLVADAGALVNVYGKLQSNGTVSDAVVEKVSDYAMGSDALYLKGKVTAVSAQIGRLAIGGTTVDYTALLSDSSFHVPALGDTVEIVGTQPTNRGVVLAAGVIQTGSAAGVIQTGSAAGVIQTGSAAGVIQTGSAAGVIQTGSAAGVIQTGYRLGVIQTGSAAGVIQTGSAAGVIQTGSAAGVIQTGSAAGVIQTGSAAGVIQTGSAAGVIQTGSAAGVIQTGARFGVTH